MISIETIQDKLSKAFPDANINIIINRGMYQCEIPANRNLEIISFLKNDLGFQFLTDITASHYPDEKGRELCIISHMHNLTENTRLRLRAYVPIEQPDTSSLVSIFSGADWMERETYDFFGINFIGHPNLVRILNVDEMDYFPMRKEYQMEDPTRLDKDDIMFGRE
ncbi:MAG TPA: NADH-quinone oxidoreductase subunit C [Edaphocola sp.]|nr:NADH-quinone oxidoreductase subunit C [Edaphocola sp.]